MPSNIVRATLSIALSAVLAGCATADTKAAKPATTPATEPAAVEAPAKSRLAEVRAKYPRYSSDKKHDSGALFDQSKLQRYDLFINDADLAFLNNDPAAEKNVEGALLHNGKLLPAVGVRYKGGQGGYFGCLSGKNPLQPSGNKTCTKLSMRVDIDWKDRDATFYGQKALLFHSQNIDPTKMRERLGYYLFGQFGVPSPRSVHAKLYINGEFNGIFALTEHVDDAFIARHFDDKKGNLYKEVWPLNDAGQAAAAADLVSGLKTNKKRADVAQFVGFANAIAALDKESDKARVDSVMREWFDVDTMMRYVVVDRAIAADDGIFHWYCRDGKCSNHNFYWYQGRESKKVHLIPWDLDMAFENLAEKKNPITAVVGWNEVRNNCEPFVTGKYGPFEFVQRSATCDKLLRALTTYTTEYDTLRTEFEKKHFNTATVHALIDQWSAQVEPALAEAAATHKDQISVAAWKKAVEALKNDLAANMVKSDVAASMK